MSVEGLLAGAVDLGGTKLAVALVDQRGRLAGECVEPLERGGRDAPVRQMVRLLSQLCARLGLTSQALAGVGVGVPGLPRTAAGGVWAPNIPGWDNYLLEPQLRQLLALPVAVENDGRCAALGEAWVGAARHAGSSALLIVGTGIGGGAVVNGQLLRGHHGLAGAYGWFPLPGTPSARAGSGDLEYAAAGPALDRAALELALAGGADRRPDARALFEAAAGQPAARAIVERFAGHLAHAIANLVAVIDPELILLGGGVSSSFRLFEPWLKAALVRSIHPYASDLQVLPAQLGNQAGLLGAARLVFLKMGA